MNNRNTSTEVPNNEGTREHTYLPTAEHLDLGDPTTDLLSNYRTEETLHCFNNIDRQESHSIKAQLRVESHVTASSGCEYALLPCALGLPFLSLACRLAPVRRADPEPSECDITLIAKVIDHGCKKYLELL